MAAELACMKGATPELRTKAQERIHKQVSRISNMTNELLEFTRGAQAQVALARTDYGAFVRQLVEEIGQEVAEKKVEVVRQGEYPAVHLMLDVQRVSRVFFNLIHNAVDAMPGGGKVYVRVKDVGKEMVTEVEDTGKGIAPEIADRLFEPFATFGKAQGTGLGLSICRRIIEDHRGHMDVISEPGRGAVFKIRLPKSA
jgi:signal transduction histidine kinase